MATRQRGWLEIEARRDCGNEGTAFVYISILVTSHEHFMTKN